MAKEGIKWRDVDDTKLPQAQRKLLEEYKKTHKENEKKGHELAAALRNDWDKKYPKGKDGKRIAFKIVNGTFQCGETEFKDGGAGFDPGF